MKVVKLAVESGLKLYFYVALLRACTSILFANDSAVFILTPIVLEVISQLKIDDNGRLAYLFSARFIADTAAMSLITSNPVNIVSADFFKYSFVDHPIFMGPVAVVTIYNKQSSFGLSLLQKENSKNLLNPACKHFNYWATNRAKTFENKHCDACCDNVGYVVTFLYRLPVSMVICSSSIFLLAVYHLTQKRPFSRGN